MEQAPGAIAIGPRAGGRDRDRDRAADVIAPRGTAPRPAYIEVGERIRMAGFTCQREGTPGREQPVVCPGELLLA